MKITTSLCRAAIVLALASFAFTKVSSEDIAITGGTAFTNGGSGKITNATILMSDGKIVSVTSGGSVPSGYRTVDATGKWVTTGFMVAGTSIGMGEVPLSGDNNDATTTDDLKHPISLDVQYSINPNNSIIANTRIEGITRAVSQFSRTGSMWLGTGAVVQLGGKTAHDMIVRNKGLIRLNMDENAAMANAGSRSALWESVINKLESADPSTKKNDGAEEKKGSKENTSADKLLTGLFDGSVKLHIQAHRASDIRQVINLKKRFGINIVLIGGNEAWVVADDLAASDIAVILNPLNNLPGRFDMLASTGQNATRLHTAGVKVAFLPPDTANSRLVAQSAGNAVAMGLPWSAAIDALTINPAEIFGINNTYGKMAPKMDADVVVWDGDPLEVMTSPDVVFIQGEEIPLVSRQTKLRDRYLEIPRAPGFVK